MVKYKEEIMYNCNYCSFADDDEDVVFEHMREDHLERPTLKTKDLFICEVCSEEYKKSSEAKKCELKHEDNDDIKYKEYLRQLEFNKLYDASNKEGQRKLI